MHTVQLNKKKYFVPDCWDEVTPIQMLHITQPLLLEKRVHLFLLLSQIPLKRWKQIDGLHQMELLTLIDWTDTLPVTAQVKTFKHKGVTYISHDALLEDISIINLAYADMYFMNIVKGEDIEVNMNKLISCICLTKAHRESKTFIPKVADIHAKQLADIHPYYKLTALIFYRGCRDEIVSRYDLFESQEEHDTDIPVMPTVRQNFGFFGMINELSKSGQYGTYDQTCNTNAHIIFTNRVMDLAKPNAR